MTKYRMSARRVRELWLDHSKTTEDSARELGVSRQVFAGAARRLGLPPRPKAVSDALKRKGSDAEFRAMWLAGVALEDMRRHFGYAHHQAVVERRERLGLPKRRAMPPDAPIRRGAPISLHEYRAARLAEAIQDRLDAEARATRAAMVLSEMVDQVGPRPVRI